ncbi:alpha/beta fold hydrolase [Actinomadura xylanilytica]|uniref:alpha/beta fold hydrolase n=1 Tax=Actinomadura xylanilytica TaxID=887459 RepID=UPI00255ACE87|nr:alpha/beta hydrolase [Actinomadura xylanilytica]MDL4775043.1 alpha/beta hydrolase [Actinomadura xylanilytica]
MPEVTARGVRFHVQTMDAWEGSPGGAPRRAGAGPAPVVVFVHGLVTDNLSSFYYSLARPVSAAGAHAVMYDLRGHGRSECTATGHGAADAARDLFAILGELGHHGPVHLVGNSYGGVVALNAALARPDRVAGLILIEAYGPAEHAGEWTEGMLNSLGRTALALEYERQADQLLAMGWRQRGRQAATADALINGTSLMEDLAALDPVRPADLATLSCPVLAVYGEHSDVVDAGTLLLRSVPGCTLHIMAGHAHTLLREGTEELLEVMLPWLSHHAGTTVPAATRSPHAARPAAPAASAEPAPSAPFAPPVPPASPAGVR